MKFIELYSKDLDEAYRLGHFQNHISRWALMDTVEKKYPTLRWYANKTHRGLFDGNKFICGISHNLTIPPYNIYEIDNMDIGRMLVRGWKPTLHILHGAGYEITEEDLFKHF